MFNISFDALANIDAKVTDLVDGELETNLFHDSFIVSFEGILQQGLKSLSITKIEPGTKLIFKQSDCLSPFLTPYISKSEYDDYATAFLEQFYPEALEKPCAISITTILKRMNLTPYIADLPDGCFGQTIFAPTEAVIFKDGENPTKEIVPAGSILVNSNILKDRNVGSLNNTIIHECLHWYLHRMYFELQILLNSGETSLKCFIDEIKEPDKANLKMKNKFFMEQQARGIAPRVLMPKKWVREIYDSFLKAGMGRRQRKARDNNYISAMYKFSSFFNTSIESSRIRIEQNNVPEVQNCFSDQNGKRKKLIHSPGHDLDENEYYYLNFDDVSTVIDNYPDIRKLLETGAFCYADGYFVVNDPKYVIHGKSGDRLTAKARRDVSKCCLIFKTRHICTSISFDPRNFNFYTFSNGSSEFHYQTEIQDPSTDDGNAALIDTAKSVKWFDELQGLLNKLEKEDGFCKKFDCYVNEECLSDADIARRSKISDKTIAGFRKSRIPSRNQLLAICAGLRMPTQMIIYFMQKAGYSLTGTGDEFDMVCYHLILTYPRIGLKGWNDFIKKKLPDRLPLP